MNPKEEIEIIYEEIADAPEGEKQWRIRNVLKMLIDKVCGKDK